MWHPGEVQADFGEADFFIRGERVRMKYLMQRRKVALIYERIANQRNDCLQKISSELMKNLDVIGIQDLPMSNMVKNHKLARCISEVSWAKFKKMLEYKAEWYGKEVVAVVRNFPSSQLCSACGYQNKEVKDLALQEWEWPAYHSHYDRDHNASKNIKREVLPLSDSKPQELRG